MKKQLKIWEQAMLIALCITLFAGLFAKAEQNRLSDELIRLHVIANSDSDSDQAAKLRVRDRVLSYLSPKLNGINDIESAERIIRESLSALCIEAESSLIEDGKPYQANAQLCIEHYPTRSYDGFSLPNGDYISLKIILGEGSGHNWWCVVFPPLCMSSVEDEDAFSSLTDESSSLIKYSNGEYRVKFRIVELYGKLKNALS